MSQLNHEINNKKIYLFVFFDFFFKSKILPRDLESLFFSNPCKQKRSEPGNRNAHLHVWFSPNCYLDPLINLVTTLCNN